MNEYEGLLNKGDVLCHCETYELSRDEGHCFIRVVKVLAGGREGGYFATPHFLYDAEEQFVGRGTSPQDALKDCLLRIKEHPIDTILNHEE
jgi:hypothetical protein